MANYGSNVAQIQLADNADALQDISAQVRTINGIDIEALTQESYGFGVSWVAQSANGMGKIADITIGGFYNDAANTPKTLFVRGATRRFQITYGGGHSDLVNAIMVKFSPVLKLGALTEFTMILRPTGTPTQA